MICQSVNPLWPPRTDRRLQRPHRHLQPAAAPAGQRARANEEFLVAGLVALGGAIEPVEGFGRLRLAGEQFLERRVPPGTHAGQALEAPDCDRERRPAGRRSAGHCPCRRRRILSNSASAARSLRRRKPDSRPSTRTTPATASSASSAEHNRFGNAAALEGQRTQPAAATRSPRASEMALTPRVRRDGKHSRGCVAQCLDFCHAAEP